MGSVLLLLNNFKNFFLTMLLIYFGIFRVLHQLQTTEFDNIWFNMSAKSFKVLCQEIDAQLFELLSHVICSICQGLFQKPVKTPCGHSFCNTCIKKVLSSKDNNGCPLCKCVINRYCLEDDKAKFTISEIFRELPNAFRNDVKDGCKFFKYSENDLLNVSNIIQLSFEYSPKKIINKKRKTVFVDFCKENSLENIEFEQNEAKNFIPNLKKNMNNKKCKITKKKEMGDFISISQAGYSTSGCQNNLQSFQKNLINEKIQEQLNTTSNNNTYPESLLPVHLNFSQTKSSEDFNAKLLLNIDEKPKEEIKVENSMSMIRVDYKKTTNPIIFNIDLKKNTEKLSYPYKFVPNLNSDLGKKSICLKKEAKLKSTQSLIKKSIKMKKSSLEQNKKNEKKKKKSHYIEYNNFGLKLPEKQKTKEKIAEPEKFEMILEKTKVKSRKNFKRNNITRSNSVESCIQIVGHKSYDDLALKGQKPSIENKPLAFVSKGIEKQNVENEDNILPNSFSKTLNVTLFEEKIMKMNKKEHEFQKKKSTKKEDLKNQMNDPKESFLNLVNLKNEEALRLEQSVEKYLMSFKKDNNDLVEHTSKGNSLKKNLKEKKTALSSILEEIIKDESIYSNRAKNVSIKFSKKILQEVHQKRIKEKKHNLNKNFCMNQSSFYENSSNFFQSFSANELVNSNFKDDQITQKLDLTGFTLKKEIKITKETKFFEKMIKNMEIEPETSSSINSNKNSMQNINNFELTSSPFNKKVEFVASEKGSFNKANEKRKNYNLILDSFQNIIEETKAPFISFLLLGRLTPTTRRSKSSVVKLVFPVGFTSFIRKHAASNKYAVGVQTSQTLFQPFKNSVPESSIFSFNFQKESYSDFASQIPAENQTFNNIPSAIFQSSQIKKIFVEQNSQDMNQSKNVEKDSKKFLNTSNLEENNLVCFEESQVQIPNNNKMIENSSQSKCETKSLNDGKNLEKNYENSLSPNEQLKALLKTLGNSLNLENEISVSDRKLTENKPLKLSKYDSLNKAPIDFLKKEMKRDEFTHNHKNLPKTKNKKNKESSTKYENFPIQSKKNFLNFETKDWNTNSPKKFQIQRTCKYFKADECDTDLTLRNDKKVLIGIDKMIDLGTDKNTSSQGEILQVLKNIDLDRITHKRIKKKLEGEKSNYENSEESDSDFFVEQTPPSLMYSRLEETKHGNKNEIKKNLFSQRPKKRKIEDFQGKHNLHSENSKDGLSGQHEAESGNTSSIRYLNGEIKMSISNENIDYDSLQVNVQGDRKGLWPKKFDNFSQEELLSNIHDATDFLHTKYNKNYQSQVKSYSQCQKNKVEGDFNEKLTGNKLCKTTENVFSKKKFCIVASSIKDLETIKKFVTKFKFEFLDKPSKTMTHLIVGLHENEDGEMLPLCTPKLLFALANKKWVVSELWAETCLKVNKILPEESFETYDPVGGLGCRIARLSRDFLLENCEIYLLGNFGTMSKNELEDLIIDCGGTLISQPENFSYSSLKIRMIIVDKDCLSADEQCLRELYEKHRSVVLSRDVIIMSIQTYTLSNFFPYLMHGSSTDDLVEMGYPFLLVKQEESNWDNSIS